MIPTVHKRRSWQGLLTAAMGLVVATPVGARAADEPERPMVETWQIDPETGEWRELPRPVSGTEDGDLDLARQAIAREEYKDARKQLDRWIKAYGAASARYPEALYLFGTAQLELGDYRAAHDAYQALLNDFPGSAYAERALAGDFRIAEQYLAGKRRKAWKGLLRVRDRDAGIEILDDIATNFADTEMAELALVTKADYYYARGEFTEAEFEYARLAREYPRSRYEPYALLRSAASALASFPGVKFDDAGLVEAEERFIQFQQRYPKMAEARQVPVVLESIRAKRAQKEYETARFYERTHKRKAAAFYYRSTVQNYPGTTWAAQAEAKLAAWGMMEAGTPTARGWRRARSADALVSAR
jgi:outer membrane assembly lipoprotein YfiO